MSLMSRFISILRNGVSFQGRRNLYEVFGWNANPQFMDYLQMYRRNDLAKRVVNAFPAALWVDPPQIQGDKAFQTAWNALLAQTPVFFNLQRLHKLTGIGKYSTLFIGFDDGADPAQPVNTSKQRKVLFLQPYSEAASKVVAYDTNTASVRFGKPTMYEFASGGMDEQSQSGISALRVGKVFNVHYTRVVHLAENALESMIMGRPRLESVFNSLCDVQKVTGSSAETYWLAGNRGLHVDVDKEMELDDEDATNLEAELTEYQHEQRRVIRTRGVKVNAIGSDVANPKDTFDVLLSVIAADTGIPKRVLMGSEAGQLASQQDRANWATRVEEAIAEVGEPLILIPFIRTLIDANVLPPPTTFTIIWPDPFKMNPLERAQTSAQMARSAANLSKVLQNIEDLNQSMARASMAQLVTTAMTSSQSSSGVPTDSSNTDGVSANQLPLFPNAGAGDNGTSTKKPTTKSPQKAGGSESNDPFGGTPSPTQVVETAPLMPKRAPIMLLDADECRRIIGFGKHPPVFDDQLSERIVPIGIGGK